MSNEKLELMLQKVKENREKKHVPPMQTLAKNTAGTEETSEKKEFEEVGDLKSTIAINEDDGKKLSVVNKLKANRLKNEAQLKVQGVIFDSQITKLKHQAEAVERQSKAYWDAKSVDFSEGLKTYAQQNMLLLENARLDNKSKAVLDAYLIAQHKMDEVLSSNLPDSVQIQVLDEIEEVRDQTLERIKNDLLANKYDLGPNEG